VTDLTTGRATVIRDLFVPAGGLSNPVVWAEVFADCDDPPTEARWSRLQASTGPHPGAGPGRGSPGGSSVMAAEQVFTAASVGLNYQSYADGGCANTLTYAEGSSFVQVTGLPAARPPGPAVARLEG
jgi:hypothetical protein